MSRKEEIVRFKCGVTLTRIAVRINAATVAESYQVVSEWTPGVAPFPALAEAEAYFASEVARAPQRPSLYGDRYKPG